MQASAAARTILETAVEAVRGGDQHLRDTLDALDAPLYVTDAEGVVTHFNSACLGFTGRHPTAGKDRWCVTWRLYTNAGEFLPHDECPMAVAIRSRAPIRGVTAVAERPDGTRVKFMPLPTPVLDEAGALSGAVNMLIDVTEAGQVSDLRLQAAQCRRLARTCGDKRTAAVLSEMGAEYDQTAGELEAALRLVEL